MNISDIIFIVGQWNWNTINGILVFVLVLITGFYAWQVRKQTKSADKDRKRNKILEEVEKVLNPFINKMVEEIDTIDKCKSFSYSKQTGFGQKFNEFFDLKAKYSYAFRDIIDNTSSLKRLLIKYKLRSNDKLSNKLNGLYTKIDKELTTEFESEPKFDERLKDMVHKFNQSHHKQQFETRERDLHDLKALCKEYIISKWDLNNVILTGTKREFLKENKDKLLKYIDLPMIKELRKEIENTLNPFKKSDEDLLELFNHEIKKKLQKEYSITDDDMGRGLYGWDRCSNV